MVQLNYIFRKEKDRMNLKHKLSLGFIYFLILLAILLFVRDIQIEYNNLLFLTPNELLKNAPQGIDPAAFMRTALEIARDGWITASNQWVFNLWPPGFVLLEALIIKLFGVDAPIILILQVLTSILFSF